jgi:outer membrane protein OmpA-like peptidoglycan-associated protein
MLRRCAVLALACVSSVAVAQQPQIAVKPQFKAGEPIAITVTPPAAAVRFDASLDHEGKPVQVAHGPARAGEHVSLKLPGPGHYKGQVVTTFRDGNRATVELEFDAVVAGAALKIGYTNESYDADAHRLTFTMSHPAGHADLKVLGEAGKELATAAVDYTGERAGTPLAINFTPKAPGDVVALELRVRSSDGASGGVRLVPWSINVPHKEVVFETGKWDIRPSEEPKLDAAYQKIADEVARARKSVPDVPVKLFIAGYTDTVGSNADNRKLSLDRARAIATWFRDRGLPLPIEYAGFGEEVLKVKTADNTDSEPNRRADYIVGFQEPMIARGVHAQWMKLQ